MNRQKIWGWDHKSSNFRDDQETEGFLGSAVRRVSEAEPLS